MQSGRDQHAARIGTGRRANLVAGSKRGSGLGHGCVMCQRERALWEFSARDGARPTKIHVGSMKSIRERKQNPIDGCDPN